MKSSTFFLAVATATLIVLTSTAYAQISKSEHQSSPPASVPAPTAQSELSRVEGVPQALGNGTIRSYVQRDRQNSPQEMGVIFTRAALENLPAEKLEVVVPLPSQTNRTAITHIGINWQPHGHDPEPIYGAPHFDFHFYTLTPTERERITATGSDLERAYLPPDASRVPPGYVLAPDSAEPRMGAHWVAPASEELQGTPHGFNRTLIYGYYNGDLAFIEPMASLAFLQSQPSFASAMPVPTTYTRAGDYPTGYRIDYNSATGEYIVALTGFTPSTAHR